MKKLLTILAMLIAGSHLQAQVINPGTAVKESATDHTNNNITNGVSNGMDKAEGAIKGLFKKKGKDTPGNAATGAGTAAIAPQSMHAYQNYDFVPGDNILFEDQFIGDQDGEFPASWSLDKGQAVLNQYSGKVALLLTDGNYVYVDPRMKKKAYLSDPFTIEYDTYLPCGNNGCGYGATVFFRKAGSTEDYDTYLQISNGEVSYTATASNLVVSASLPAPIYDDNYKMKWHHIAIACKNAQLKVYVDQYRVLMVPDMKLQPANMRFGGIGQQDAPIVLTNIRIASGGSMNMIGKKFTDTKIVTHGINFDIDKATIKPESMGTLNMVAGVMKDNPDLKFEVDGHTDNSGLAPHNLTLSQQRAEAVKAQLMAMGIDGSRLTAKGFGDTKPVGDNASLEGKANNRRVEFVKQ